MLAHHKGKQGDYKMPVKRTISEALSNQTEADSRNCCPTTKMTCDALCALSNSQVELIDSASEQDFCEEKEKSSKSIACPKQHQLPMFLSKTYHMIDRCDQEVATWAPLGDSFVIKNVEKFATSVLPMYFKHSNFSSFARQLNFYGFRKLKAEPILTADYDAHTASQIRFYHEKFQKDKPELLQQIKRATKSEQQSKDDFDSLRSEINKLRECMTAMGADHDRRMTEMSYEYNRRITALSAEYDKLAVLVHHLLAHASESPAGAPVPGGNGVPDLMHSLSQVAAMSLQNSLLPPSSLTVAGSKRPLGEAPSSTEGHSAQVASRPCLGK